MGRIKDPRVLRPGLTPGDVTPKMTLGTEDVDLYPLVTPRHFTLRSDEPETYPLRVTSSIRPFPDLCLQNP